MKQRKAGRALGLAAAVLLLLGGLSPAAAGPRSEARHAPVSKRGASGQIYYWRKGTC